MTRYPQRSTRDGQAYLDLRNLARRNGRLTEELLQIYALEGFLGRLVASESASQFVLKGGVLLAAYQLRRPTRDVDLQGFDISNAAEDVRVMVADIAALARDDGIVFDLNSVRAEVIREEDVYSGVRVKLGCRLGRAVLPFHVDVNVGDPVSPGPRLIELPCLLGGSIKLMGFPLTMVFAEKLVTALQRHTANTRWRDFADVYLLCGRHAVNGDELSRAVIDVAAFRNTPLVSLSQALSGFAELSEFRWRAWLQKLQLQNELPESFADVLAVVATFADQR